MKNSMVTLGRLGIISVILTGAFTMKLHAQLMLTNGLVAYYPLNLNANDASGNTNNGTISGATWINGIFGTASNALYFGASRVVVNDSPSLDMTNAITLSAWFKADNWNTGSRIINKGDLQYQLTAASGVLRFEFVNSSNTDYTLDCALPSVGHWHNSVATYDGSIRRLYIDGVSVATGAASGSITVTNGYPPGNYNLNVGAKSDSANPIDFFSGSICKVRIYKRALATNEVPLLYQYELSAPQLSSAAVVLQLSTTNLVVGGSYQIQTSTNLVSWQNYGTPFIATATNAPQYINMTTSQGYYRILTAP